MNKSIKVISSLKNYQVSLVDSFEKKLLSILNENDIIIIDNNLKHLINAKIKNKIIGLNSSENQKSFHNLEMVIEKILLSGFRKDNKIIVIGGGIMQDTSAFISSILFRGVSWVFFPTTLLAMADSCIGGKTSINFNSFKNQLGNFFPPDEIYIDVNFLEGLNENEIRSGIGEMAHYFLVADLESANFFFSNYEKALQRDSECTKEMIIECLNIKKSFIEKDEFDTDYRLLLNYGHTFGHALEAANGYKIPHGIAISHGMNMANFWSLQKGYIEFELYDKVNNILRNIWGNVIPKKIIVDEYVSFLKMDKKCVAGELRFVLTKGIGEMFLENTPVDSSFSNFLKNYSDKYFGN